MLLRQQEVSVPICVQVDVHVLAQQCLFLRQEEE